MGATQKIAYEHDFKIRAPERKAPAVDYSDQVSAEQIEAIRKKIAPAIDSDEWVIVDGPAW